MATEWACKEGAKGAIMLYSQGHIEHRVDVLTSADWTSLLTLAIFIRNSSM